ncbi:arginine deiminase family protein [Solirubrobacter phytolaccae]|uniref:Arginine deiminase family protein n=1 Tax=Solirubrobacter phytolaccae TaxID=1404360 RepID=A0A9X3NE95_9ACTN|nr:arginine deiminase family protein [Solirubrobacter phytolaccae]MDA0183624.1 arginine deiminase family protein [Solirubrobacter phytolaccae]
MSSAPFGVTSMVAPLQRVLVRKPATSGDWDGAGWRTPDATALERQHEQLVELLDSLGVEVVVAEALDQQVDAVYMHDSSIVSGQGAIPLNMAKAVRKGEPAHAQQEFERLGIPILGTLEGDAYLDGGDHFYLDDSTVAVGLGYRTNQKGAQALQRLLDPEGIHVEAYDMPHDQGPDYVLHLQSFLSGATENLFVVYEPLAPVRLLQDLKERGIDWIAIDDESYHAMGCNILPVRPGVVIVVDGAPKVRSALEAKGVEVHAYDGTDLSLKGDGGPTCLTAPLLRA